MNKNKKGLSTVVTTLIIILLVLVAVGIIWGVVSNLLNNSSDTIGESTSCLELELKATALVNTSATEYDITLERTGAGINEEIFAKVTVHSDTNNSAVLDSVEGFDPLAIKTLNFKTGVTDANLVKVTPYILNEQGEEILCNTIEYSF